MARDPSLCLPDGRFLETWERPATFSHTCYVDQAHPEADDANPGTPERPLRTIQAAADILEPAQRVVIHGGVYRETVRPRRGGTGPEAMIHYEAAPGEEVVISGGEKYIGPWHEQTRYAEGWKANQVNPNLRVYHLQLPGEWFVGYLPFGMVNLPQHFLDGEKGLEAFPSDQLWKLMLKRGLVFQDGRRLSQVRRIGGLNDQPGAYWCESTGRDIYLRPFDDAEPGESDWQITTREQALVPQDYHQQYIRLAGLTFRHCADGFTWLQRAAVSAKHGDHWIVEDCRFHDINANGLDLGTEHHNFRGRKDHGYDILRGNTVQRCGLSGFCGSNQRMTHMRVEDNHFEGCGWHELERVWENAALKMHRVEDSIFRRNLVTGCDHASGIWLDFGITNTRITANVILDTLSAYGGVFIEAAKVGQVVVDHNIIGTSRKTAPVTAAENAEPTNGGHGVYAHDSDRMILAHNLIFDCQGSAAHLSLGQTERMVITGRGAICRDNGVFNNVMVNCARGVHFGRPHNHAQGNAYVGLARQGPFQIGEPRENLDFEAWQQFLHHDQSATFTLEKATIDRNTQRLKLTLPSPLGPVARLDRAAVNVDEPPRQGTILPGPFADERAWSSIPLDPRNRAAH